MTSTYNNDIQSSSNILVIGPSLSGKSSFIRTAVEQQKKPLYELTPTAIYETKFANGDRCLSPGTKLSGGVMLIRHIDVLLEDKELWVQFNKILSSENRTWAIACTAKRKEVIPKTILQKFNSVVEMQMPDAKERLNFLKTTTATTSADLSLSELESMANRLGGVGYGDLRSIHQHRSDSVPWSVITSSTCSIMSRQYNISTPHVVWNDIIGHTNAKQSIKTALSIHSLPPDVLSNFALSPCTGILLYGLPGNGKTMLAKVIATELQSGFLLVSIPSLVKSYVGESEEAVRNLFKAAKQNSPCCIFLDEVQAIFGDRQDSHGTDHDSRLVSQLLAEMDNLPSSVTVIAATNVPSALDSSILSPGRLDMHIHVRPPTISERIKYISTFLPTHADEIGNLTAGYSYADLTALKNIIQINLPDDDDDEDFDISSVMSLTHPSYSNDELSSVENWIAR